MAIKRNATAVWRGTGLEGSGTVSGPSGVLNNTPYNFKGRFENADGVSGTNPEELIAAAHAGCFNMALSFQIAGAGYTADELETTATLTLNQVENGFAITEIQLDLKGKVSGMDEAKFKELAETAKVNCPVSKALSAVPISLKISYSA